MPALSKRTGFDRATTRRLCLTLVESGYLLRRDREFALASRVLTLADGYLHAREIGFAVQPVLNGFAEELDNDIALAALDGESAVLVAQSSTARSRVSMGFTVGSRLPLLHTALGTALLSHASSGFRSDLLARPIPSPTEAALDDPEALLARIERAEREGFAAAAGEFEPGIKGLASLTMRACSKPCSSARPDWLGFKPSPADWLSYSRVTRTFLASIPS